MSLNFAGSSSFSGSPISQRTIDSRTLGYFDARYINTGERIPQSNLGCETTVTNNKTKIELHETTIGILLNKISVLETKVNSLERSRTSMEQTDERLARHFAALETTFISFLTKLTALETKVNSTMSGLTDITTKVRRLDQFHLSGQDLIDPVGRQGKYLSVGDRPLGTRNPPESPEAAVAKLTDLASRK